MNLKGFFNFNQGLFLALGFLSSIAVFLMIVFGAFNEALNCSGFMSCLWAAKTSIKPFLAMAGFIILGYCITVVTRVVICIVKKILA